MALSLTRFCVNSRIFQQIRQRSVFVQTTATTLVKKPEIPVYVDRSHEYKSGKTIAIKTLESLFDIKTFDAYNIAVKNQCLYRASRHLMKRNYAKYTAIGVTNETLLKYPTLLAELDLDKKIALLKTLPHDLKDIIVLVLLPMQDLIEFVRKEKINSPKRSRLNIISNLLHISKLEVCNHLLGKKFLRSMSSDKLEATLKILLNYQIPIDEICNDLWVLNYSKEQINNRLNIAKEHKIETLKTWMVRATPDIFQHYIQRKSDNKLILGDNSLAEYLSERLDCNIYLANYIINKQPVLKNKSLKKLNELIDFLFAEGFKSYHICRVPKILVHSVETTKKRLKQLEDKNIKIESLHMLTKSKKQFEQYYEILLKNKLKNEI